MKTRLISKAVMLAVFALNTSAYAEGFNLERISKDTLDQAYIGGAADQGVETSVLDTAAQTKAPAAAERPAAAKPALAAKVPMPATADSKQYKNASEWGDAAHRHNDMFESLNLIKNAGPVGHLANAVLAPVGAISAYVKIVTEWDKPDDSLPVLLASTMLVVPILMLFAISTAVSMCSNLYHAAAEGAEKLPSLPSFPAGL